MYPIHTGSVLLDIANAKLNANLAVAAQRRQAAMARSGKPDLRVARRPRWFGLVRTHHPA